MAYRLAIADDERLIRESLAQFIPWEELGFLPVLVAEDGEPVIDMLKNSSLDAVLCDIHMQEKTGLDVAEFVWRQDIECTVVLLSGYEEFEYARRAIAYNVSEYLLKPINLAKIREAFQRVKEELDKRAAEKAAWEQLREKEDFFRRAAVEQMVEKSLAGVPGDREACRTQLLKFGVDQSILEWPAYMMEVKISPLEEYQAFGRDILYNILQLIAGSEKSMEDIFLIYGKEENEFRVLLLRRLAFEEKGESGYLNEVAGAMRDIFGREAEVSMETGDISLQEMLQYLGTNVSGVEERSRSRMNREAYLSMIARQYLVILNMCQEPEEAAGCLDRICGLQHKSLQEGEDLKGILTYMQQLLIEQFTDMEISVPEGRDLSEEAFRDIMEQYYNYLHASKNNGVSLVESIKRLVKERIGETISLTAAAEYVFLSPNYFSRIFKEETGEKFSEYCIRVKMEKAADLIKDPGKKVYEIGEELGYHNIKYFYKLFKRTWRCTPLEYREKCNMGAERVYEEVVTDAIYQKLQV